MLCFACLQARAQHPYYRLINKANGLPSNTVYDIKQGKDGSMWLGTDKGLCKYDGANTYVYSNPNQTGKGVTDIYVLDNGEVYCQNFSGQLLYTQNGELLIETAVGTSNNYYPMCRVGQLLLFFSKEKIHVLNPYLHKVKTIKVPGATFELACVKNSKLYFCTTAGKLIEYDGKTFATITQLNQSIKNSVGKLYTINEGILISLTNNKSPVVFDYKHGFKEYFGIDKSALLQNVVTIGNDAWVCTSAGVFRYSTGIQQTVKKPYYKNYRVSSILRDNEGAYWLSTLDNGLVYIPNIDVLIDDGGKGYQISSLAAGPGKNTIVTGTTNNSLLLYNSAGKSYSVIDTTGFTNEVTACYYDTVANQYIYSSSVIKVIKNGKPVINGQLAIKDIAAISTGAYVFAYSNGAGVYFYPAASGMPNWVNKLERGLFNVAVLPVSARTRAVVVNPNDTTIYIAGVKGLHSIYRGRPTEITYANKPIIATSMVMYAGRLYIGTYTLGILCYNPATHVVSQVLANRATQAGVLKIDAYKNRLFFVTEYGLYAYGLSTGKLDFWNQADGLPDTEIADLLVKNDTAWLATHSGLVMLNVNTQSVNTTAPPIFLTGILCNNKPAGINTRPHLPYKNNNLEVRFSVPAYKGAGNIKVLYKLNDDAWATVPAGNRVLLFKSLASGSYTLQVKALNEDGVESTKLLILQFTVALPYYQSRWFIVLLLLVVTATGWLIYKYRINKLIKKQKEELERQELKRQLDESTLKTLRAQMNPHFIHNALNSIQSYVYSGEKELASKYLGLFSDLSRSLLDSSSLTEITLYDEIKLIELYLQLECIRLPKIQYTITKQQGIQEYVITIPAMILQPLVENAINHGFANKTDNCKLQIRFSTANNTLLVEIEDNGIGRAKSLEINARKNKKYQSFSTQAIQNRITILNKNRQRPIIQVVVDLYDDNNNAAGTLVKLSIPIEDND